MSRVSSVWKYGVLAGAVALAAVGAKAQGLINNPKISAALANQLVGDSVADDTLARELQDDGLPVHTIGDCVAPRHLDMAILEAHRTGRSL